MKKTSFLAVILLICFKAIAQMPTLTVGGSVASLDKVPLNILGETQGKIVVLSWVPSMSVGASMFNSSFRLKDYRIALHDSKTLDETDLLKFPELQVKGIEKTKKTYVEEMILRGDTIQIFATVEDGKTDEQVIVIWNLNALTLKPYEQYAQEIGRFYDRKRSDYKAVTISEQKKYNRIIVAFFNYNDKTENTSLDIKLFDNDLNPISTSHAKIGKSKFGSGVQNIDVDREGNIYVIYAVAEKYNPGWEDNRWVNVLIVSKDGGEPDIVEIKLNNGDAINGEVVVSAKGEVNIIGQYAKLIDAEDKPKELFAGTYLVRVDPETKEIIKQEEIELTDNQKISLTTRTLKPIPAERSRWREMINMRVSNIYTDPSGTMTLVSYPHYAVGTSSSAYYFCNSLIVTQFAPEGTINWQTLVPRAAFINGLNYALDPFIFYIDGQVRVLFNDHGKNKEYLAEGPKKSTGGKKVKGSDDVDAPIELYAWNVGNTALRFTTINSDGTMKVEWLEQAGKNDDTKVPAIEASVHYKINDHEYLTAVYTKYGMLGFQKNAISRITF